MKSLIYLITFITLVNSSFALEDLPYQKNSSFEGIHFFVGFMENEAFETAPSKQVDQRIFISSQYTAQINVMYNGLAQAQVYTVHKNEVLDIPVIKQFENSVSEVISKRVIEIKSDFPITVYAFSGLSRSSDSYSVIPISNWGKDYSIVSLPNDNYNPKSPPTTRTDSIQQYTPRSSEFLIMSAYDNTEITVMVTSMTRALKQIYQPYKITLNKGECYLVQSWPYQRGAGDLSGSRVTSNKPIGILSGHVRSAVLQGFMDQPPDSKDHLIEMLSPTTSWGKNFISIPFGTSPNKGDYFKINSIDTNTTVSALSKSGQSNFKINNQEKVFTTYGYNEPVYWVASAPVQLTQFMMRAGDTLETVNYDPSMVVLPPIEQFVSKINFITPGNVFSDLDKFISHFVTLVAEEKALSSLRLNGILVDTTTNIRKQKVIGTNFYWARIELGSSSNTIEADSGRFSGVIFGTGRFDSYAMVLGSSLVNPFVDDITPPDLAINEKCSKLNGRIFDEISDKSFGIYYAWVQEDLTKNFKWKINSIQPDATEITFTAEPIDIHQDGTFVLDFMDKNSNARRYTYQHQAVKIDFVQSIEFGNVGWKDSLCFEFPLKNLGKDTMTLKSIQNKFPDSRLKYFCSTTLPFELLPDSIVIIKICLNPKTDISMVDNALQLVFDCDYIHEIPVTGNVLGLDLLALGHDFGKVKVGDTVCYHLTITNQSNTSVKLNHLNFINSPVFLIDTLGRFPKVLGTNETIEIPVCFTPISRNDFNLDVNVDNEYKIKNNMHLSGSGIAPDFNNITINWGKRRLGTTNDTSAYLYNKGNTSGLLNFIEFKSKSHTDNNSLMLESMNNLLVNSIDSTNLNFSFIPTDTNDYKIISKLDVDWKKHPELTINLLGKGTIPVIKCQNHVFEDTEIYQKNTKQLEFISSEGNEILSVDSIYIKSGDINSFSIRLDTMKNFKIKENTKYIASVDFVPKKLGNQSIIVGVMHDANPNYKHTETTFKIEGKSIPPLTTDLLVTLENNDVIACNNNIMNLKLKNTGSFNIDISSINIETIPNTVYSKLFDFKPKSLTPGEEIIYKIEIIANKSESGKVIAKIRLYDMIDLQNELNFNVNSEPIFMNDLGQINYKVGDSVSMIFSGKIPYSTNQDLNWNGNINIDKAMLILVNKNYDLELNNNGIITKYPLEVSQTRNSIDFKTVSKVNYKIDANWKFSFDFMALFNEKKESNLNITIFENECYKENSKNFLAKSDSLCIDFLRSIKIDSSISFFEVHGNPANTMLNIELTAAQNDNFEVYAINEIGDKYLIINNLFISKGLHKFIFDINTIPVGVYNIFMIGEKMKLKNIFVKIN